MDCAVCKAHGQSMSPVQWSTYAFKEENKEYMSSEDPLILSPSFWMCCNTFACTFAQLHTAVIYLELEHRLVQILTFHHHCALLASAFEGFMFPVKIGGSTPHSNQQFYDLKSGEKLNWCRNIYRFSLTSGHWSWNKQNILLLCSREELAKRFDYICLENGRKKSRRTISRQILCLFRLHRNIHDKDEYGH